MVDIFKGYFEEDFDEDSIRDNFTLVYELLDGAPGARAQALPPAILAPAAAPTPARPPPPLFPPQRSSTTATRRTLRWTC